jgi:hypothetical protein
MCGLAGQILDAFLYAAAAILRLSYFSYKTPRCGQPTSATALLTSFRLKQGVALTQGESFTTTNREAFLMNLKIAAFMVIYLASTLALAQSPTLVGVWEVKSAYYDDESIEIREPRQVKVFTERHVFYTYYDASTPPVLRVGHGTYTFDGTNMVETIANHSNEAIIGGAFSVEVEINAAGTEFTQVVDLGKYVLRETWQRIE